MSQAMHQRTKAIFLEACQLEGDERNRYLDRACDGDEQLRSVVESMLEADRTPLDMTGSDVRPHLQRALDEADTSPEETPVRIGRYRVTGVLGRGGMGVVYKAEQRHPNRAVAVKLIQRGLLSAGALRRFEHEADVLGRLQHTGIARIYEAGVGEVVWADRERAKRPFFAMELLDGEPIDRAAQRLEQRDRLELFARVCDAVQHAHSRGVIHRDLKPANVLVRTVNDSASGLKPVHDPVVLDFGVARLTGTDSTIRTMRTRPGDVLGTLAYMSPEALDDSAASDTRSDVYSLGVMLYELLSGQPPLDLQDRTIAAAAATIRDVEPASLGAVDAHLRGDLETIARKALEKDPDRRYQSAAELAADVRRHLGGEAIAARAPSRTYRIAKFVRRNKAVTGALATTAVVLLATAAVSTWLAIHATEARDRAVLNELEARKESGKYEAVTAFLTEVLGSADPQQAGGRSDMTVRDALGLASSKIAAGEFAAEPEVEIAVRTALGGTYRALAMYSEAERQLVEAIQLGEHLYPDGHEDVALAINKLGRVQHETGRPDESRASAQRVLDMRRAIHRGDHADIAIALNNLGYVLVVAGQLEVGRTYLFESLEMRERLLGPESHEVANSLNNIGWAFVQERRFADALPYYERSVRIDDALFEDHSNLAGTMSNLAYALVQEGRPHQAEKWAMGSLAMRNRLFGGDHPETATARRVLGVVQHALGRSESAERLLRESLDTTRRYRGGRHIAVADVLGDLAVVLIDQGRSEEAAPLIMEALQIRQDLGDNATTQWLASMLPDR
jgi:tetratricopeptide (TPR) repeat protein/predicted Ser/Thr protein kinase